MDKDEVSLYDGTEFLDQTDTTGAGDEAQRRLLPFLEAARSSDSKTTCNKLAAKCAELQSENDKLTTQNQQLEERLRLSTQKHENEMAEIQKQLEFTRKKRDEYYWKSEQLEQRIVDEESLYYRNNLGGPRLTDSTTQSNNVQPAAALKDAIQPYDQFLTTRNTSLQQYFTTMDESQTVENSTVQQQQSGRVEVVQQTQATRVVRTVADFGIIDMEDVMNQTQTVAANLTSYADRLFNYRTNVMALYEQLKGTAKFLAEVVKRVMNEDDPQIGVLLSEIDALQLDIDQNQTVADQIMNESKHMGEELSVLGTSMRAATEIAKQQPPQLNLTLLADLEDARQAIEQLKSENQKLNTERKDALKQCVLSLDSVKERDEELENRSNIIDQLTAVIKTQCPVDRNTISSLVKNELERIYDVMSAVPHKVVE